MARNKASIVLEGNPQPKQEEFLMATTKYVGYGGSRGGGKSWSVRYKAVVMACEYSGIKILIVRRSMPELRENHILPLMKVLGNAVKYKDAAKAFEFPNGSRIKLGYIASDADITQYQGQEYDIIFIDEATQITEFQYNTFKACLRGVNDFPKRMYITCNPGGVGMPWVKRLFIDKEYHEGEDSQDYTFIPARVYDNVVLMEANPEYIKNLESLPPGLKEAWLYGSWDAFVGQYFKEFDRDIHVVEPFPIPNYWNKYRSIDYGFDMLSCLWIAVNELGEAYVYKELHESGLNLTQACNRIKEVNGDDHILATYAPPDLWHRRQDTGKSGYEIFLSHKITLFKSKNSRIFGWSAVREWLQLYEKKTEGMEYPIITAKLKFFRNCTNIIKNLPQLRFSEKDANDVAKEPHDITHDPDALRGFCVMRPLTPGKFKEDEDEPDMSRWQVKKVATYKGVLGGRRPKYF